ncbi:hypothetical protein H1R20_g9198, partial [Candolleomyces eurysporus]
MSRNPSPAPQPSPAAPPAQRTKQKPLTIAAGAEDVKYQGKYKELKRKVKDIEADNDKLHIKVMNAKLTIQRMKMERASTTGLTLGARATSSSACTLRFWGAPSSARVSCPSSSRHS